MNAIVLSPALALLSLFSIQAQDAKPAKNAESHDLWLTDFAAAKAQAKKQHVDILMDFTGSDWCGWCIKLHQEVFDTGEFQKEIGKHFVLLELDYPQKKKLPEALVKQNDELKDAFAIEGYPTIMLVDDEGKPYAQTGYQPGGPTAYLKHLGELKQKHAARDAAFVKAATLKGVDKAKALSAGLDALDKGHRPHYAEVMDQICELDADNKAGLKEKIGAEQIAIAMASKVRTFQGKVGEHFQKRDFKPVGELVDAFITEEKPEGSNLQQVLYLKSIALANQKEFKAAAEVMQKALDADPSGERVAMLKNNLKQFEQLAKNPPKGEDGESGDNKKKDGK